MISVPPLKTYDPVTFGRVGLVIGGESAEREVSLNGGRAVAAALDRKGVDVTVFDGALALLEFERKMPLDTYLWPSKCKVGWGAGELLRVLVNLGHGDAGLYEQLYQVAERVGIFTFLDAQLADGGWPWMHYPLSEIIPEVGFSYKPLKGTVAAPPTRIDGSQAIYLPREEITGEFLGELAAIEQGTAAWLSRG